MEGVQKSFLPIGGVIISDKPEIIWTPLGSCIAIILYHPARKIAAVCHGQLPEKAHYGFSCTDSCPKVCLFKDHPVESDMKYLSCAFNYMMDRLKKYNINLNHLDIQIYGGAELLNSYSNNRSVGSQNILATKKMLTERNLKWSKEDTGGNQSRTIYFDSRTGNTLVKYPGNGVKLMENHIPV